jgi:L-ascorbate metabolism protein UlaG (beta-lactamase superfamily)
MNLTKHVHACVTLEQDGRTLVIDPGAFAPDAAELVAATDTVLLTHEHFDHVNEELITSALSDRPELHLYGPAAIVDRFTGRPGQVTAVVDGDRFTAAGFDIAVYGTLHACIHHDIPLVANVGYLVDGHVYHPGDAYHVPPAPVRTLLLPTSGPWTKLGEAADFVRAVDPGRVIQIHEIMLSEMGQQSAAMFLGPDMLTKVPLTIVPVGTTVPI